MSYPQILAVLGFSLFSSLALALDVEPYSAAQLAAMQRAGKPVALHFHADWCPTCRAQAKVLDALRADKSLDLTVLVANYDTEKDLKKRLGVRMQSTFVVFKGEQEVARIAGETAEPKIRAALAAAR